MKKEIKRVLIVEDELPQREALKDKITENGFAILEAKNGEEGLEVALREHPDVVLLDIVMPKMGGIEMAKLLRQDKWGKDVPVLILSNLSDVEKVQQAMDSKIFEYFVKSDTKIESIAEKIKELLK